MLLLEIFGDPIPLKRPRTRKIGGFVSVYDPQKKEKDQVRWQVKSQYREKPLSVPLFLDLIFGLAIPKSTSRIRRKCMLENEIVPMKRPDVDNLIKFILDCLNGILFDDDSQIISLHARKIYSEYPRTIIRVENLHKKSGEQDESTSGNSRNGKIS